MNVRRELTVVALLAAAGVGLAVTAGGRVWATVLAPDALSPVAPALTGGELAGAGTALGWAGLAGLVALFATRGRVRSALGVVFVMLGAGIAVVSGTAVGERRVLAVAGEQSAILRLAGQMTVHPTAWWAISLAGGLLLAAAGSLTVARGARWPGLSARYDPAGTTRRPGGVTPAPGAEQDDPSGLWKSIDRGEDPTVIEHKEH